MSTNTEKNNDFDNSDNKESENQSAVYRQRIVSVAVILSGVASSFISGATFGYMNAVTLGIPILTGILISTTYYIVFEDADIKGALFIILTTLIIWYISSTFAITGI